MTLRRFAIKSLVPILIGAGLFVSAAPVYAAVSIRPIAPNADGTYSTQYPNGDKPVAGCDTPNNGYAEADLGDAGGEICEQSASEFDFAVSGTSQPANYHIAYKDAGAGDVQIEARITDSYSGASSNFANVGIGIRESSASTSWLFQCHSLQNGSTALQVQYGSNGTYTTVNGAAGQSRPRYCAVTYDVSTGDIKAHASSDGSTWTEIASTNRAMSDVLGYFGGTSRSTSETFAATIDNYALGSTIDAYTPGGGGGGGPTLVTEIENQAAAQGVAYALSCAANFSGATSYSIPANGAAGGLASGTGLSFNTASCAFSGTPDADDVGTRNITVTATNAGGSLDETFQLTVSAVPGDTFTIATSSNTRTYDCDNASSGANNASWASIRTSGSGTQPLPGDIIVFAGGTHSRVTLQDCTGTSSAPIIVRNDVTDNEPAVFQWNSGSTNYLFRCIDCLYVQVDGTGKWVGADSGSCGVSTTSFPTEVADQTTVCGIQLRTDGNAPMPQTMVKFSGMSSGYTIKGLHIDGTGGNTDVGGIGIDCNDHSINFADFPNVWREDITITQNALEDIGFDQGEGMYCGPNAGDDDLPLRRITISYNLVDTSERECINGKYWREGPNYVHHNVLRNCSAAGTASQSRGINITDGGDVDIYSNLVFDNNGNGISHIINSAEAADPGDTTHYSNIYNNIIVRAGSNAIFVEDNNAAQDQISPVLIYNNTVVNPGSAGVNNSEVDAGQSCIARDNILADTAGAATVSACTNTNNDEGSTATRGFVNAGADNYELSASATACNNATANAPATDYEDEARPQDSADDQGADEATACP